ncbi:DNA-binding MarR family transcriptional regulator [Streptomyces sp. SAI-124]
MAAVDLTTHPGHLARRLQQAHYLLWNTMVSEEITSPQFAVLNALVAEPGLDQRTVGERVGLDRSTIAEVISRLGRRGLLDKVRDPQDGRRFLLRLTDDGVRTHRKLTVRTARMNQVFLAPLSEDEQHRFFELIRRGRGRGGGAPQSRGTPRPPALIRRPSRRPPTPGPRRSSPGSRPRW